jgi:formate dehydrogenase subunit beta
VSRQEQLRKRARELLESKQVVMVVGHRAASTKGKAQPVFVTKPEETEVLIFDETCGQNLANYLLKVKHLGKIAVVAKGCDSRSILVLLKEKQLDRAQLHILGVGCEGIMEDGKPSDSCTTCAYPNPVVFDEMVGEPAPTREICNLQSAICNLTSDERWQALSEDVARCVRCYACRQVCPNCYCPVCFVDASQPALVGKTTELSDNMVFHIMRALHMAGRCVECGSCARACPMGVDLMKFNRKAAQIVKERFNTVAGVKDDDAPPLAVFDPNDKQEFIR